MPICQHCGAAATEDAAACPQCGAALEASARNAQTVAHSSAGDAGTSPLRIALAVLAVAVFALGFWALSRNSTDHSASSTQALIQRRVASNTPARPAQSPANTEEHDDSALNSARRMTVAEARAAFENGTAVLADVRSRDAYNTRHIKNAILLDEETLHGSLEHLPKDKLIITYCA